MLLDEKIEILRQIIDDGGTFKSLSPDEAYRILTSEAFALARTKMWRDDPDRGYDDIFTTLEMCALDAMGSI